MDSDQEFPNNHIEEPTTPNKSVTESSPPNNQQEDDLNQAAQNLNDFDDLCELVSKFESAAFEGKKTINSLDRGSQQCNILPQTLKMCFQILNKFIHSEKPHFDEIEKMEQAINDSLKGSTNSNKEFSKFKGEFFALNDPIINKDLSSLKVSLVKQQLLKQEKHLDKIQMIQMNCESNQSDLINLKERFENFQQEIFQEKQESIDQEKKQGDEIISQVSEICQEVKQEIAAAQKQAKMLVPQNKEQISKLSEIQMQIVKIDRKHKKFIVNQESMIESQKTLNQKSEICKKIVETMQPEPLNKMINQTNQIEKLLECYKSLEKFIGKIEGSMNEIMSIQEEIQENQINIAGYQNELKGQIQDEFNDLQEKINQKSDLISNTIEEQNLKLDNFEKKILDVKISDADQFFLNKEIMRFRNALNSIESQRDLLKDSSNFVQMKTDAINHEDLQNLRSTLKQLVKQEEYELPKQIKNIDGLDQFVMKSLKNSFKEDSKKSQALISKIKKSSEDLQKKYENLGIKFGDSIKQLNTLNEKFDTDDLERINEIELLEDRLREEGESIGGNCSKNSHSGTTLDEESPSMDDSKITSIGFKDEESVHRLKRNIVSRINTLVIQFNQLIKEGSNNKSNKTESAMNDLILKNKNIQDDCSEIMQIIDETKQMSDEIQGRLENIMNEETIEKLKQKYSQKEEIIEECEKMKQKAHQQCQQLTTMVQKQNETISDIIKKLDLFNPINNSNACNDEDFLDRISEKIDESNAIIDSLYQMADTLNEFDEKIQNSGNPLKELGEREVQMDPEIEKIKDTLMNCMEELQENEGIIMPKTIEIAKIQKAVKEILDSEIENRLKAGQQTIEIIEKQVTECGEIVNSNLKKLKYYKDQLDRADKKYAQQDTSLLDKFAQLQIEEHLLEKEASELEGKVKDLKKKKSDAKKILDEIIKNPQNFTPNQIDTLLTNLDELKENCESKDEKLQKMDKLIDQKLLEFESILLSSTSKQELSSNIQELNQEIDQEVTHLGEMLEKLPNTIKQLKATALEMQEGTNPNDDYFEKKDEIEEQIEELSEIQLQVDKFNSQFDLFKKDRSHTTSSIKKASSLESLQKISEQLNTQKGELTTLFTDALDTQEQLLDLKRDIGDCDIPTNIAKRKNELLKFSSRLDRLQKELTNLKKAKSDFKVDKMVKEVDLKLNELDKSRKEQNKVLAEELEQLKEIEFEDFSVNHEIVRKIRKFKTSVEDIEIKLKDAEEIQNEVVRTLTEKDIDSSADVLGQKAQDLRERLQDSKDQLKKITIAGDQMDGNTSHNEEEEFILALKNEMPEVFENIETTLNLLKDTEKLVSEVKQTLNVQKMNDLKEKVGIASENVDESESLVSKLHKELLEWNAQKKLLRRDQELDEIQMLCGDFLEDLSQEKINTEIELEKNREKQDENKGQDMVDKDGNKVDIMKDLIQLEGQMNSYLMEIDVLLDEVKQLETQKDKCLDDFNGEIPKIVCDQRKKRHAENAAAKSKASTLKRPAQLKPAAKKSVDGHEHEEQLDIYKMLATNCNFKKTIHQLLKDLKNINKKRKDLEDRYSEMRKQVFKIKQIKLYKPLVGDVVDEMFAGYLNKAKLTIEVQRISASNYMFGTKKILAKIINGRLVIRVGGGYMNAEEFIEQYGKIEMMKMMKMEENKNAQGTEEKPGTKGPTGAADMARRNAMGAEIKEKMRQSLMKHITPYQTHSTNKDKDVDTLQASINAKKKSGFTIEKNRPSIDVDTDLKSALEKMKNSHSISKLNLPGTGNNSPLPGNRTGLNSSRNLMTPSGGANKMFKERELKSPKAAPNKMFKDVKSPKAAPQLFNSLTAKPGTEKGTKIGAGNHSRRATISENLFEESNIIKPRGSFKKENR